MSKQTNKSINEQTNQKSHKSVCKCKFGTILIFFTFLSTLTSLLVHVNVVACTSDHLNQLLSLLRWVTSDARTARVCDLKLNAHNLHNRRIKVCGHRLQSVGVRAIRLTVLRLHAVRVHALHLQRHRLHLKVISARTHYQQRVQGYVNVRDVPWKREE